MRHTLAILVFAFILLPFAFAQQPPTLSARWVAPRSAVITWESSAELVCLYRETKEGYRYFLQCYTGGSGRVELPWRDFSAHPAEQDTYCATFDVDTRVCAPLLHQLYFPFAANLRFFTV